MSAYDKIESPHNPRLKALARLRTSRGRKRETVFLIDGVRETLRAILAGQPLESVILCRDYLDEGVFQRVAMACAGASVEVLEASPQAFDKIAFGQREEGVVAVAKCRPTDLQAWPTPTAGSIYLVLESIEKPGNLGAIFRTADAFGISGIILTQAVVLPENPNAIRASLGTIFSIPYAVADNESTQNWLATHKIFAYAARVQAAQTYWDVAYFAGGGRTGVSASDRAGGGQPVVAIVLGSEARGLSPTWQGSRALGVSIPQMGIADSLNLSVATAVLVSEVARQRHLWQGNAAR